MPNAGDQHRNCWGRSNQTVGGTQAECFAPSPWDASPATGFSSPTDVDAALATIATSLLSFESPQNVSSANAWTTTQPSNKTNTGESPIYLSDASTRAASMSRHPPHQHDPVDAFLAEFVHTRGNLSTTLPDRSKYTAAASVCRSTFHDRNQFIGNSLEWTPSPSSNLLTLDNGVNGVYSTATTAPMSQMPSSVAHTKSTSSAFSRTRTLSHSSSPLLPGGDGFTLRAVDGRVPAASYHGSRRLLGAFNHGDDGGAASILENNNTPLRDMPAAASVMPHFQPEDGTVMELSDGRTKAMLSINTPGLSPGPSASSVGKGSDTTAIAIIDENLSVMRELKLEALLKAFNITLDHTRNAVTDLPECVKMILPVSPEGELLSVGSILHYTGGCRNCIFNSGRQGCHNGLNCVFCHHAHPRPKRRSRKRVSKSSQSLQTPASAD